MIVSNLIKKIQDIMRKDAGVDGDAQRIKQLTWMLFLKIYDANEMEWEKDKNYKSLIPEELKWRNWAIDNQSSDTITGDRLINLVNDALFPTLKEIEITDSTPLKQKIIKYVFNEAENYMKDGINLRQVINVIKEIDFTNYKERHEFGAIYETILKDLQSAGNAGEFYTPRAVTDFMVQIINPKLGECIADFACGTGGFLASALKHLESQCKTAEDNIKYNESIFGIEKKHLPYLLCITNMLIHNLEEPRIYNANSLEKDVRDYKEKDKFDIILMNPPYGGHENKIILNNFPADLRSSETADLFINIIMYRLKKNGRCAVIIPDGFLFGKDSAKLAIKKKLLDEFNLHTIIRLPHSVFAPYTSITTNILFFDNNHSTNNTWYYRMDMPEGYKHFNKTKPILLEHFKPIIDWWTNRKEIIVDEFPKAKCYSKKELEDLNFNLDLCGYPHIEDEILEPKELIQQFRAKRDSLNAEMDKTLTKILELLDEDN